MEIENVTSILMKFYENVNPELRASSPLTYLLTLVATNSTGKSIRVTKGNNHIS